MPITISPSGADDTAALQAAINGLPNRGGDVVLAPGTYNLSDTIAIGDGNGGPSTRWGVRLRGEGAGRWTNDWSYLPSVALNWSGGAKPMAKIAGPLEGWSLENIGFLGNGVATIGLQVLGASCGDCANITFNGCAKGIVGANATPSNAMHNKFRNVTVWTPETGNPTGIWLGANGGAGNSCYWHFDNTTIFLPGGNPGTGIYLGTTDTNLFVGTHLINGAGGGVGVLFDYSAGNGFPNSNGFVGIDPGVVTAPFQNSGVPAANLGVNWIRGFDTGNGAASPQLAGLMADTDLHVGNQLCARAKKPVAGEVGLLLAVNRSGTIAISQVKVGASNSGGSGKRALVVDN